MNHPLLPQYASSVYRYGYDESAYFLSKLISKKIIEQEVQNSFLSSEYNRNSQNDDVIESGAGLLNLLIANQHVPQTLDLIKCLTRRILNIKKPSVNSIKLLEIISRQQEAIPILDRLNIVDLLKKLTGIKATQM